MIPIKQLAPTVIQKACFSLFYQITIYNSYFSSPLRRSEAIAKVGAAPAIQPQTNILNYNIRFTREKSTFIVFLPRKQRKRPIRITIPLIMIL